MADEDTGRKNPRELTGEALVVEACVGDRADRALALILHLGELAVGAQRIGARVRLLGLVLQRFELGLI